MGQVTGGSRTVDIGAAIIFAAAIGYSTLIAINSAAGAAAAAASGFLCAKLVIARIGEVETYRLPDFAVAPVGDWEDEALLPTELAELLLTDKAATTAVESPSELLLEDRLEAPAEDSRIIRLFDPRRLPTAGEMHDRIEEHLRGAQTVYPDATTELHRALSELRSSLK